MQVTVSRVSPVEVELKVSLPKERVTTALSRAYTVLGKNAQIKGFRRGKVPLPLLKQYFGPRVAAEVADQLVGETLPKAIEEQKLEPVNQPEVRPDHEPAENADFAYTVKLEVRPQLDDVKLEGIELKRQIYTVADTDVDHQIEHLREQHSTLRTPEPARPAKNGDVVTLDYEITIDGAPREDLAARGRTVQIGEGRLLKEIDDGIVGLGANDTKDITVKFADDHSREDLRGKAAVFKVKISEVREKVLPEVDDEFAKDAGHDSLAALKTKVRADLEKQGKDESEGQLREDAVQALVEKNPIAVPPSLAQNAVGTIAREVVQNLRMRNEPIDAEAIMKMAKEQAEMRVRAGLLLAELARRNSLSVTEDDMNAHLEEMAKETGKAVAKLRAEHRDPKRREALANAVLEDKVLKLLLSKVSVTDVPATKPLHEHEHG